MRTRAERRHNTRTKQQRHKSDTRCGGSLTPSGERCTCSRCEEGKYYDSLYKTKQELLQSITLACEEQPELL